MYVKKELEEDVKKELEEDVKKELEEVGVLLSKAVYSLSRVYDEDLPKGQSSAVYECQCEAEKSLRLLHDMLGMWGELSYN